MPWMCQQLCELVVDHCHSVFVPHIVHFQSRNLVRMNWQYHVLRFQKSSVHICSTGTSVLPKRRVKLTDYDYLNVISSAEKTSKSKLKPNIVELLNI